MNSYNIKDNEFELLSNDDGYELLQKLLKAFPNQKYIFTLVEDTSDILDECLETINLGETTEHNVAEFFDTWKTQFPEISSLKYEVTYWEDKPQLIEQATYTIITKELTLDKIIKFMENFSGEANYSVNYDMSLHTTIYQATLQKV